MIKLAAACAAIGAVLGGATYGCSSSGTSGGTGSDDGGGGGPDGSSSHVDGGGNPNPGVDGGIPSGGGFTVMGSAGGVTVDAKDGFAAFGSFGGTRFNVNESDVIIVDLANACATAQNDNNTNNNTPGVTSLVVSLQAYSLVAPDAGAPPAAPAIVPGTYKVVDGSTFRPSPGSDTVGFVQLSKTDATCKDVTPMADQSASGGSITITTVDTGNRIAGSFSATFADGTFTGTFDATNCPFQDVDAGPPDASTCK